MRRITSLFLALCFLGIWGLVTLPAQQKSAAGAKDSDIPVFKTSSNLVLVTVYVRGKDGKPVPGLKPEDFTVVENGKQQAISVFEYQNLSEDAAPAPAVEKKLEVRPEAAPVPEASPAMLQGIAQT